MAGFAKTRLIPQLGSEGAAALATRLLYHTLAQAQAADIGPVELCCAPDTQHPTLGHAAQRYGATLTEQGEGDLGTRMHRALVRTLSRHHPTIIIGTDAPCLDAAYLRLAATALAQQEAVFGPAFDGGYTLIGLHHPHTALFDHMPWSTAAVMTETRQRLKTLGIAHAELATLHDVDEPADLAYLPADMQTHTPNKPKHTRS